MSRFRLFFRWWRYSTDAFLSLVAKQSNHLDPDCFVAVAPRNDKSPSVNSLPPPFFRGITRKIRTIRVFFAHSPDPRGYVAFFGLLVLLVLGIYLTSIQFASVDQSISQKNALYELQARQAVDAGLAICLRAADGLPLNSAIPVTTYDVTLPSPFFINPDANITYFFTVWYETTGGDPTTASVTARVYKRLSIDPSTDRPLAEKTGRVRIDVAARRFINDWRR